MARLSKVAELLGTRTVFLVRVHHDGIDDRATADRLPAHPVQHAAHSDCPFRNDVTWRRLTLTGHVSERAAETGSSASLWGAESPSELSGGPTGPATIRRRPCSSACLTWAFRLLMTSLSHHRDGTAVPPILVANAFTPTFSESAPTWRYAGQIQPAGATPSRFDELESPSAHMAFDDARARARPF